MLQVLPVLTFGLLCGGLVVVSMAMAKKSAVAGVALRNEVHSPETPKNVVQPPGEVAATKEDIASLRELVLLGHASAKRGTDRTFGEYCELWFQHIKGERVDPTNEVRYIKHLKELHQYHESELTVVRIKEALKALKEKLTPQSINKLRSTGKLIITHAQGMNEWGAFNPFVAVKRLKETPMKHVTLSKDELFAALECLRPDRRRHARIQLFTGIRNGEGIGLKKIDIDLAKKVMNIRRSHGRDSTKTGKDRAICVPDAVWPDLMEQMEAAGDSEYVFPAPDGNRQKRWTKLSKIMKTALISAGVCSSWQYKCRRKGCFYREEVSLFVPERRCPKCQMRLWASGVPKAFRWYDLRHQCATWHRIAGADSLAIKVTLGHAVKDITEGTYTHLQGRNLRDELNKLAIKLSSENSFDHESGGTVDGGTAMDSAILQPPASSLEGWGSYKSGNSASQKQIGAIGLFLKAREVAEILRVKVSTIYHWVDVAVLVPVRVGPLLRFRVSDIESLVRGHSTRIPGSKQWTLSHSGIPDSKS